MSSRATSTVIGGGGCPITAETATRNWLKDPT
jgi:hypothetical protein